MMVLKSTSQEYTFTDPSGYCFTVTATYDPETGWSAYVEMAAHGYKTPEDAIRHLTHASKEFTRQVEAVSL